MDLEAKPEEKHRFLRGQPRSWAWVCLSTRRPKAQNPKHPKANKSSISEDHGRMETGPASSNGVRSQEGLNFQCGVLGNQGFWP